MRLSQQGVHQLALPSRNMVAGTTSRRMIVALTINADSEARGQHLDHCAAVQHEGGRAAAAGQAGRDRRAACRW